MPSFLKSLFGAARRPSGPALAHGERVYAVGDIHGRSDLFAAAIRAIETDEAARAPARTSVILLGDLIDRGPDSAGVIRMAREWQGRRQLRILMGNHEEMFLDAFENPEVLRHFLRFGGRETLLSYPVAPEAYGASDLAGVQALMRAAIPAGDIAFIRGFEDAIRLGDYLFVHAGVDPARPLDQQRRHDLHWIREPFLSHHEPLDAVVVHGHTIFAEPSIRQHRIGIDTGAYASGRLTVLGLEGTARWIIAVSEGNGAGGKGGAIGAARRSFR